MRKNIPIEFIYQIFSLILVIILVHGFYVSVIRPNADAELRAEQIEGLPRMGSKVPCSPFPISRKAMLSSSAATRR